MKITTTKPPVIRGSKIAHTEDHADCIACVIILDSAMIRRLDV